MGLVNALCEGTILHIPCDFYLNCEIKLVNWIIAPQASLHKCIGMTLYKYILVRGGNDSKVCTLIETSTNLVVN